MTREDNSTLQEKNGFVIFWLLFCFLLFWYLAPPGPHWITNQFVENGFGHPEHWFLYQRQPAHKWKHCNGRHRAGRVAWKMGNGMFTCSVPAQFFVECHVGTIYSSSHSASGPWSIAMPERGHFWLFCFLIFWKELGFWLHVQGESGYSSGFSRAFS